MNRDIEELINYYDNVLSCTSSKINKIYISDIFQLSQYCELNIGNGEHLNELAYECIIASLKAGIVIGYKAHTRDLQTKKRLARSNQRES